MKVFFLLLACLLAGAGSNDVEMSINFCQKEDCECPLSQEYSIIRAEYKEDLNCFCSCGALADKACSKDGDCVHGLHCAAGDEKGGHGRCEDACKKPGFSCDKFEKCKIGEDGKPMCVCSPFRCSQILIGAGICANDPVQNKNVTYPNDCLMVNVNCERLQARQQKLKKLAITDCAEVHPPSGNAAQGALGVAPYTFERRY